MAENSKIEWTTHTWNPWIGCQNVSPGCDHCYAEDMMATRYGRVEWGPHGARSRTSAAYWRQPLKWNREAKGAAERPRVFCASLADVFDNHASITSGWRGDLWHLIDRTPNLDWLLLTKRPQNIRKMLPEAYGAPAWGDGWPNVWLGVTAENQTEADRRIPILLDTPARIRFVSAEPLLGPIDFTRLLNSEGRHLDALQGSWFLRREEGAWDLGRATGRLAWVISGGESGPHARPTDPTWMRKIRDDCAAAGVAYLFKQWGAWHSDALRYTDPQGRCPPPDMKIGKKRAGRLLDGIEHNGFPDAR